MANSSASNSTATVGHGPCFRPMPAVSNGILQGDVPLHFALPLLTIQIALVLLVTRSVAQLFKPIKQPRVLAEIIGGVLLGPTALGRNKFYLERVFPPQSLPLLETVATMGLMFFIFMVGMELDLNSLKKIGKNALVIAVAGIAAPFVMAVGLAFVVRKTISPGAALAPLIVFTGAPLSISAFSVLVRIMAELKLLSTDVGRLAVPIAAVNDVTVWTMLAVGVAIAGSNKHSSLTPVWVLLLGTAFGAAMLTVVRAFMTLVARRATSPRAQGTEIYVCVTLVSVLMAGFFSDAVGIHPLFGPFLLGLVIPKDNPFPKMIISKIEDFVTGLMLPLFFASSGLKTNLGTLHGWISLGFLVVFFATAAVGKIMGTFVTAKLAGLPTRRALILGFLVNTKGLAVLIVLNVGRDLKVLTDETFAILVLTALLTSFVTTPVVSALCKPVSGGGGGQQDAGRSVEGVQGGKQQLRVMACGHEDTHFAATMNLVEAVRGSKGSSPVKLYTLRLVELSERPSAIHELVLSNSASGAQPQAKQGHPTGNIKQQQRPHHHMIPVAFQPSSLLSKVTVRPLTAVSQMDSIHEDVCRLAAEKRATILLLPYLRPPPHLSMFAHEHGFYKVNSRVLDHAPCSVGILVDIGSMGASTPIHPCFFSYKVVVLFLGGPDDREALALGTRMADHPGVALKVVRILTLDNSPSVATTNRRVVELPQEDHHHHQQSEQKAYHSSPKANHNLTNQPVVASGLTWDYDATDERLLDDEAISKVKEKAFESSFAYEEEKAGGGDQSLGEAISLITRTMTEANMFVVGRRRPQASSSSKVEDHIASHDHHMPTDCSELGDIGDMVLSCAGPDFHACLLVIQRHMSTNKDDASLKPDSKLESQP